MSFKYPVPDDPYYDYLPITGPDITVGMDILSVITSDGAVTDTHAIADYWYYTTSTDTPWGVPTTGIGLFPVDPTGQSTNWWQRLAVWVREAKPAERYTLTSADGSRWIYPADADGMMVCYWPGGSHARGDRLSRGAITTSLDDPYIADDPDWDWLPVVDGATVMVGDYIQFAWPQMGVVTDISTISLADGYDRTTISKDVNDLGFYDTVSASSDLPLLAMRCTFYQRLLKPARWLKFSGTDGSRWIFDGTKYFSWGQGSSYPQGSLFSRGEIPPLTPLPADVLVTPPLIREVIQTPDDLTGSATLTTSGSVVTGDVLLIVYATDAATPSDPTSSAGTCTQVGTDATDGYGTALIRVYRCPVGSDGAQTVDVAANTTVVVLVLTDGAVLDGFAKSAYDPEVSTATLPSVSPTGIADLFVGIYFNQDGESYNLAGSGLVERAAPKVAGAGGNHLSVGTVGLESSSPTAAAYPATTVGPAKSAVLAVVMARP